MRASRACRSAAASSRWSTIATAPISAASESEDQFGYIEPRRLARVRPQLCRGAGRADRGAEEDEAIAEADTLLLTVPNQLGVDYNAHVIEAILKHVAPGLGWR